MSKVLNLSGLVPAKSETVIPEPGIGRVAAADRLQPARAKPLTKPLNVAIEVELRDDLHRLSTRLGLTIREIVEDALRRQISLHADD